jgi:acetolactate synthase-1/2/3 large subunit
MTTATMTLARALTLRLQAAGVTRAFGFPGGGSNLALIEAMREAELPFVLTRTEVGAAFMASATAELTRAPGVVVVGNGPGLASVVNGVANAYLDRVPLVVISDRYTEAERHTTGHQILAQEELLAPVVKGSATFGRDPAAAVDALIQATTCAPRGPVHLEMPRNAGAVPSDPIPARLTPPGPGPRREDLAALAAAVGQARRPVVLVGLEAGELPSTAALDSLAGLLRAPVLTTFKAKGCASEDGPWWAGLIAGSEIEAPLIDRADAILAVGLDPVELLTKSWRYGAPVHAVRTCSSGQDYLGGEAVVDPDLAATLVQLIDLIGPGGNSEWSAAEIDAYRTGWRHGLRLGDANSLTGWEIVEAVSASAPRDAVVAIDAGAHMFPCTSFWSGRGPRSFLISNGLATMGYAVPAAIGAALTRPDRTAFALTGDGGMAYHAAELETARRAGARVIVVVFNDASLSLIRIKHEANGGSRDPLAFTDVHFADWGLALGAHGCRVHDASELRQEVSQALTRADSTVIDARLTGDEYGETLRIIRG